MTQLLGVIFRGQRRGDPLDLEAVETAVRGTMHRAGTTLLSKLLSSSETVPSRIPLRLRSTSLLPRYSPQTTHHRGGRGAFRARLLPLLDMPPGTKPA